MPPQEQPPTDKRAASQALFRLRIVRLSAELLFLMAWMILTEQLWSRHVGLLSQTEQGISQVASLAGAGVAYLLMFGLLAVRKGALTARFTGLAPRAEIAKAITTEALRLVWALGVVLVWMPLAWGRVIPVVLLGGFLLAMYSGIGQRTRRLISGPPAPDDIRDRVLRLERLAGHMGIGDVPIKVIDPFPYPTMLAACTAVRKGEDCILLSRTSLTLLDDREMMAVVAHEVAHSRLGHTRSHPGRFVAIYGALVAIVVVLSAARTAAAWSYLPGPPRLLLALSLIGLLLHPVTAALDRRTERRANRLALELTADPAAFISGLTKLARHLGADRPLRWWERMICSAPSLEQSTAQARWFTHEHNIPLEESPQEGTVGG
jgi:Zn-dependent protease with chaperone function